MKKIIKGMAILSAPILLAACGEKDELGGATDNDSDTITLWVQYSQEDAEGQVMTESIKEFNETNEYGLTAEVEYIPRSGSGGGYEDKLNAALTTKSLPDVFTLDGPNNAAYAESGMLQSLDQYVSNTNELLPSLIEQGTYNNELYSAGYSESGVGIYYNIDLLEDAGIDMSAIPTVDNPWTWDDFNATLEVLQENNDGNPILDMGFDDHSEWLLYAFSPYVWSAGGEIVDNGQATGVFDSKETVSAFEFIQRLVENEYSAVSPIEKGFHTGKYPLYMSGSWTLQELDSEYPDINYGIMPYPVSPETNTLASPTGSWAYGMSSSTDNAEGAGKLIEFLISEEQLYNMSMGNSVLPASQAVADRMLQEVSEPMQMLIEQNTKSGKPRPVIVNYPQVSRTFQQTVTESTYYEQNSNIQKLLEAKAQEIQGYLE